MEEYRSSGYCDACLLSGKNVELSLNNDDFLECPHCHLQYQVLGEYLRILDFRGHGKFKSSKPYTPEQLSGKEMVKSERFRGHEALVWDEADFRVYLSEIV